MQHRNLRLPESFCKMLRLERTLAAYLADAAELGGEDVERDASGATLGRLRLLSCEMMLHREQGAAAHERALCEAAGGAGSCAYRRHG
jgi:hypothetical protein